jgi:diguanylate cyclase (GGDEF)-like protein
MDNQTLTIVLTLVSAIASVALLVNWAGNRQIPGLLTIAIGFLLSSCGIMLLTTQGSVTPVISILLANALILGGRIPMLLGLAAFWNQEKTRLPVYSGLLFLLAMAGIFYFTMVQDSVLWRIRIYTSMAVVFSACNVYIIANGLNIERRLRPAMSVSSNFGANLALFMFSFIAIAETILMFIRSGSSLQSDNWGTSLLLLGAIFTIVVFAFTIIIMTMEELSVEYKENSIYDPITTILNHRTFLEVGKRVLGVALRYSKPVSLLTIEVDNLDEVIQAHGYRVGNEMLRHFAILATDRRRHEDVLARSSLNEFRMLLPGVDEAGSQVVIEKIRKVLAGEEYVYRGNSLNVKLSIAAVTRREEDLNLQDMLQEGEIELYRLKLQSSGSE